MASKFNKPHIDIGFAKSQSEYSGRGSGGSSVGVRIREEFGLRLKNELEAALTLSEQFRADTPELADAPGSYIEVELKRNAHPDDLLSRKKEGIRVGAVKESENVQTVALFIPDQAKLAYQAIIQDYLDGPLSEAGNAPRAGKIEPIEAYRQARLQTLWTDSVDTLPTDPHHKMWWAVWTRTALEEQIEIAAERLNLNIAATERRLYFPEATVIPVYGTRSAIELLTFASGAVDELRRASDTPAFFIDETTEDQQAWIGDLADRIIWPADDVAAVCLLDTGVNRAHPLIEPALTTTDQHEVREDWGLNDNHPVGHGTRMAGMALHGDLTAKLADTSQIALTHRLESVTILPPAGMPSTDVTSYGVITQDSVSLPEITAPERKRVFCLTITNDQVSGEIPSTWSAAIDQSAAANMRGDDETAEPRLFVLSAGNVPAHISFDQQINPNDFPSEDPSQSWNALSVGGYTELVNPTETNHTDWIPRVGVGALSPHSSTTVTWPHSRTPIKPEIVFEAGNRAVSPSKNEVLTLGSLSLLTTGSDVTQQPLIDTAGTSPSAAQAARMAAQIMATNEAHWPEMVRALMVHSAEWTPVMREELDACSGYKERYEVIRRFGYGVPQLSAALASAQNHLALTSQMEIQPFRMDGGRKFNECHYYQLPIPNSMLEELDNTEIEMKVTLSYFIEPNPGFSANVDPQRYQSFGLRYAHQRRNESIREFKHRVNNSEPADSFGASSASTDSRWLLGADSVSAGSLHSDVWVGPAIELLNRPWLCVRPVNGWWRNRTKPDVVGRESRYALVVSIKVPDVDIDLYTPIANTVGIDVLNIEIEI